MTTSQSPAVRDAAGRFVAGNRGRAFGSRNRASKQVAAGCVADLGAALLGEPRAG